jgi:hypothetical protein
MEMLLSAITKLYLTKEWLDDENDYKYKLCILFTLKIKFITIQVDLL